MVPEVGFEPTTEVVSSEDYKSPAFDR